MHIPLLPPRDAQNDYNNASGWPSMVLQAVVDNNYIFRDISMKLPGAAYDMQAFEASGLYKNAAIVLPQHTIVNDNLKAPLMLAADEAYPQLPWLLTPYFGKQLAAEEQYFNGQLNCAHATFAKAFERLQARFCCLSKRLDIDPKFVPQVVLACVILHNLLEQQNDTFMEQWIDTENTKLTQPASPASKQNNDSQDIRNNIKNYLATNFALKKNI